MLLFLGLLPGCYSLACTRDTLRVMAEGRPEVIVVHRWTGDDWSRGEITWRRVVGGLLLYPVDVFFSTIMACKAMIEPDLSIRWGPLGAVAGIVLPGVTCAFPPLDSSGPVRLPSNRFAELLAASHAGESRWTEVVAATPSLHRAGMMSLTFVRVDSEAAADPKSKTK